MVHELQLYKCYGTRFIIYFINDFISNKAGSNTAREWSHDQPLVTALGRPNTHDIAGAKVVKESKR